MPLPRLVIPDLADKTVLITGGSTGIGAALARAFAAQGARVAIGYNESEGPAKAIVEEIKAGGGESLAVKGDVGKPADCDRIAAEAGGRFGRIDGLINNAGLMLGRVQSSEASDAHVQAVIDINARSVVSMTRAALPGSSVRADLSSTPPRSPRAMAGAAARCSTRPPRGLSQP